MNKIKYIKKFTSKNNQVWLIEDVYCATYKVRKQFKNEQGCDLEWKMLDYLGSIGVHVPKLYEKGSNFIIMEHIDSLTLCEYIENCEREVTHIDDKIILSLITQLELIYRSTLFKKDKLILNDINLRNFMIKEDQVYFIDFEESKEGKCMTDITGIIAFFLTYQPHFSPWKIKELSRISSLLEPHYPIDYLEIENQLIQWLQVLGNRRKINYLNMYDTLDLRR